MLVSHESPIAILDKSREYNDYDYALVHLFETHPEYYSFFKSSLTQGREVLLDNSIFELGKSFDRKHFAKYVDELQPTYYIVPDVLESSSDTMSSFNKFKFEYKNLPGLKIGVVQGQTYQELVECYKYMADNADYIAISFDYSWYQAVSYHPERFTDTNIEGYISHAVLERYSKGRRRLIVNLMSDNIWCYDKPHHLLGCSLANEFSRYHNIPSIRSVDTSNPVVAGLKGLRYYKNIGLCTKPKIKLADLINTEVSNEQLDNILYNVNEFKSIINHV